MNNKVAPSAALGPDRYRVEDLQIDVGRRCVSRGHDELPVSGLAFDLLLVLIRAAPNLVSIDELMQCVWPSLVVSTETVSQRVKVLRRALGDDADKPRYIASVRGHGYRMVALVVPLLAPTQTETTLPLGTSSTLSDPAAGDIAPPIRGQTEFPSRHRWSISAAILLVLLAMGFLTRSLWREPATVTAAPSATAQLTTTGPPRSVAVLPFANLTGDVSKDYLGDGMAEELINTLTKVPGLKVPARTSSFAYKGRNTDIRQIAKDLGVGTILEGSVRSAGERIRITAQLINAQDGLHLWSEDYDRKFTDLFKLQDELATAIVGAVQVNMSGTPVATITRVPPTQDVEAYRLYLQGSSLGSRATEQNLTRAIGYFQQAIARDPKFARAYAGVAEANVKLYDPSATEVEKVARQALALDPSLPIAHSSLSWVDMVTGRWLDAEAQFRAALSADANDGETRSHYAYHVAAVGHLRDSLREADNAYSLAPVTPMTSIVLAQLYSAVGHDADAQKYADFAADLGVSKETVPLVTVYSTANLRAQRYAAAADALIRQPGPQDSYQVRYAQIIRLVYAALADPSQRAKALTASAQLLSRRSDSLSINNAVSAEFCAAGVDSFVLLGAVDLAYNLANRCLDQMSTAGLHTVATTRYPWLWSPEMLLFRKDPRFQAFVTRLGMMEYWQQYGPPDECDLKENKLTCH